MKWLGCTFVLLILPACYWAQHQQDHREANRRPNSWPFWYNTQTIRPNVYHNVQWYRRTHGGATGNTNLTPAASRHHAGQRHLESKNIHDDNSSINHGNKTMEYRDGAHRYQQYNYQHAGTTPATYTKYHPGRRVCTRTTPSSSLHHHRENQMRLVYTELPSGFLCCPGWTQITRLSFGCNKPICPLPCQNGGVCVSGVCSCPRGYIGNQCQIDAVRHDVDECITEKPCAQICRNKPGSYECYCRSGFQLQADGQSCHKIDSDGSAFEAQDLERDYGSTTTRRTSRDTENEVGDNELDQDYEVIIKRLNKLEKQLARGKRKDMEANEMNNKISIAVESINEIKQSVENVQLMQKELYDMKNKIKQFELETRKIQHLTNKMLDFENRLRVRCRSNIVMSGMRNY